MAGTTVPAPVLSGSVDASTLGMLFVEFTSDGGCALSPNAVAAHTVLIDGALMQKVRM